MSPGILRTPEGIYVLENDSHLSRWIEQHKRLDVAEGQIDFYKQYIPVGGCVVDAGASLGDHTCTYAKLVGPSGRVFAIEPNPLSFEAMRLNFEPWRNVTPINCALWDAREKLNIDPQLNAGASFVSDKGGVLIPGWALDELIPPGVSRLDFIHFDLEGTEPRALRGAAGLISKFRPVMVLEINHGCLARYGFKESSVTDILTEFGYEWLETEPHFNSTFPQRDILCLPK